MRLMMIALIAVALTVSGCAKKNGGTAASPGATASAQPSTGAPAATNGASPTDAGTAAGGGAAASPGAGTAATVTPNNEPLPVISRKQLDELPLAATADDVAKAAGSKGKLVKEENGKKTYEFSLKDEPNYFAQIVYFDDGKISEKKIFMK